jgi:hypothetical protein
MRTKKDLVQPRRALLQIELEQLIDLDHPPVQLGMRIDWASFELALGATYQPTQGAPGIMRNSTLSPHRLIRCICWCC